MYFTSKMQCKMLFKDHFWENWTRLIYSYFELGPWESERSKLIDLTKMIPILDVIKNRISLCVFAYAVSQFCLSFVWHLRIVLSHLHIEESLSRTHPPPAHSVIPEHNSHLHTCSVSLGFFCSVFQLGLSGMTIYTMVTG